ncbi:MAG: C-GCAxxG-C-C family (seleno)protein [Humidesulfovibrio sp.]|nr:C-GCAxxG-C-C family (seleno)protein [Humidesulfovibrio sp.]
MSSLEYFAKVARDWDSLRAGFFPESVRVKALALAGIGAGAGLTAADLGAGTGFVTEALLAAGLTVFAVDQSPEMLARLRSKFASVGRLFALEGAAERLPLPEASVDFVFANMFLHHVDDPRAAIAEMARILRPGGRVVITDLDSHTHQFLLTEHHDRWAGFRRAEVSAWLAAVGLTAVAVDCCGENCCADSCDGADQAAIGIFAASATRPVLGIRPADADPLAVAGFARSCWGNAKPLLCAESVLSAVAQGLGVRSPLIPRLATGFCSGLSRTCGPCGAFSAGIMALGLALGRDSGQDDLDETYGPAQEFREFFLERFGALDCRALTGHDLGTPEGLLAYREAGLKLKFCAPLLEEAAAQVIRILQAARP